MTGLRIDLVSEHASPLATVGRPDAGGQNVHVAELATGLAALGCEVTVVTRADARGLPERVVMRPGVTVHHVKAGPAGPVPKDELWQHMPAFAHRVHARWLADPPDVVHAHFWMSGWAALRARQGLTPRPPVVQTFHALGAVKRRHQGDADTSPAARGGVEAELIRSVDHVVATCSDEVTELTALGGEARRVSVVPCGIDPRSFRPGGRVAPPRDGTRRRIVIVSRLVRRKGIDEVIMALPAGQLAADGEARRLRSLARRLGVADRVRLLGAVGREDVPALLRSADLVACVPWYEPFGIVPIEAMACGVPVVGSAVGGLLDTVDDRRTGLLVPPRDPRAVARAAAHLLDNPSLRRHMGAEAAARARQHYSWAHVARATLDVYEALTAARAGSDALAAPADGWAVPA
jgi:glycosyltransferase involved in cell wall biosynthesis